ncbi:7-carboxy-7-deazaguanine synthase QueE [Jeotgalibacillus haloalkalitolerans]|uniref:7-carboxy-7-deazaguanine synthase n=1 Tax=Jeotgalibacillus haloalkalitolerans TaxID=3104292 RepID=A0ABU5KKU2_9BACL|nr:7-carboxy-7-deazaguanine synthase QueE [Jeotgalibacillus sp. HH7-29]MDZ5711874.1 7-carboxy-7-deazaguanine synthase QueE [Jeotgalibacillus sp. HH7-29]
MEKSKKKFPVLEIFGPTVQGEGMVIGQKTMFVRTAGCDYSCSWCDSAFTWDGSAKDEIKRMTAEEIYEELITTGKDLFNHVTISGGNPALLKSLSELVDLLHNKGIKVALETQGSIWQDWFMEIDDLTLSPKPPSSGMKPNMGILDDIVHKLNDGSNDFSIKVVIFDLLDLSFAEDLHQRYPGVPFYLQVGNDQVNEEKDEQLIPDLISRYEWLIDQVMENNKLNQVRVLPQLHTYVWGNKRGV